jgi:hypothetical protein
MFVIPVMFSGEHKNILAHCKEMLEYGYGSSEVYQTYYNFENSS